MRDQSKLERMLIASFVGSATAEAREAVELLRAFPSFSDMDCQTTFEEISNFVYSKECGPMVREEPFFNALFTGSDTFKRSRVISDGQGEIGNTTGLYWAKPLTAARELVERTKRVRAVQVLSDLEKTIAATDTPETELLRAADQLTSLAVGYKPPITKSELVDLVLKNIDDVRMGLEDDGVDLGVLPTPDGKSRLKRHFRFKAGKLYTIGALKKTGKSKFMLFVMQRAALRGIAGHFMSLEMSDRQVIRWLLGLGARIDTGRIPSRSLRDEDMEVLQFEGQHLKQMPMEVSYHPGASLQIVRHEARRFRALYQSHKQALFFVDHLGLMETDWRKGESEVSALARTVHGLLKIAQDYELSLVLASQCPVATEYKREPSISDLKGSGAIAEDSEGIMMLHNESRASEEAPPPKGMVKMNLRLFQRDGESNLRFPMRADLATGQFFEVA